MEEEFPHSNLWHYRLISKLGSGVPSYAIATIYIGLGMKDEALHYLAKSYDEGSFYMIHRKVEPILDSLRSDPRFVDLMRRVGHSK